MTDEDKRHLASQYVRKENELGEATQIIASLRFELDQANGKI